MPPDIMFFIVLPFFFSAALGSVAGACAAAGDAMLGTVAAVG
jgi:cell division protein FtsX